MKTTMGWVLLCAMTAVSGCGVGVDEPITSGASGSGGGGGRPSSASAANFSCEVATTCIDYGYTLIEAASLASLKSACGGTTGSFCRRSDKLGGCRMAVTTSGAGTTTTTTWYGRMAGATASTYQSACQMACSVTPNSSCTWLAP